jgi:hypothetical protein
MISALRSSFNRSFRPEDYASMLRLLEQECGMEVGFRVAETPVFVPLVLLNEMAVAGAELTRNLMANPVYLAAARQAIPRGYAVPGETLHPHFLTADFALVKGPEGRLAPKLVEIQAFPSVFGYQAILCDAYRKAFNLPQGLGCFLSGLTEQGYWELLGRTILGNYDGRRVVLTEIDPQNQKTRPDFEITARRLGIAVQDISKLFVVGNKLHYGTEDGWMVPIRRIYNRAIVDELIAREVRLPFDLTHEWTVEWAGHPNWYFLISKFSIPWLSRPPFAHPAVPPAVFLNEFLDGPGRAQLQSQGVPMPANTGPGAIYGELVLKPLFSFAGKGILFEPTQEQLEEIPAWERQNYLLQQRMQFVPTIETPSGLTQAEFRILYLWPDGGYLIPALSLVRLGRGKMMGVDHNKNQDWVGASAAFYPLEPAPEPISQRGQ